MKGKIKVIFSQDKIEMEEGLFAGFKNITLNEDVIAFILLKQGETIRMINLALVNQIILLEPELEEQPTQGGTTYHG